jgi:hypothetical protein
VVAAAAVVVEPLHHLEGGPVRVDRQGNLFSGNRIP